MIYHNYSKEEADNFVRLLHEDDDKIKEVLEGLQKELDNIIPDLEKLIDTVNGKKHGLDLKIIDYNLIAHRLRVLTTVQKVKEYYCFSFWENPDSYKEEGAIKP